jgi:plastocyanin
MLMKHSTVYLIVGTMLAVAVSAFVYFYGVPNYTTSSGYAPDQPILRSYTVHGRSYSFDTPKITVRKGEAVKIEFISDDIGHDLCVEGYGCTTIVSGGASSVLSFVADNAGTFKFFCSVGNHRQLGMEGNLTVQ